MKSLKNAVVESIISDLQGQKRSEKNSGEKTNFYVADIVRISFNEYLLVKVFQRNNSWYAGANISVDDEDGRTVAENSADITLLGENGNFVPNWGKAKEVLRDTIGDKIRY